MHHYNHYENLIPYNFNSSITIQTNPSFKSFNSTILVCEFRALNWSIAKFYDLIKASYRPLILTSLKRRGGEFLSNYLRAQIQTAIRAIQHLHACYRPPILPYPSDNQPNGKPKRYWGLESTINMNIQKIWVESQIHKSGRVKRII